MKRQEGAEGISSRRADAAARRSQRATPSQFLREVREELRQVGWPTREQTINYTSIVGFVLVFMTLLIFGLGTGFAKFVSFLLTK